MDEHESPHPYRTAPATPWPDPLTVPYTGQSRMILGITGGLANARLHVDPHARHLLRVDVGFGEPPYLRATDDEVRLEFARWSRGWWRLFSGPVDAPLIVLHPSVAWRIQIHGGLANVCAELADGVVAGVEVSGGVSDVELQLPRPSLPAPIRVRGGASCLRLSRPADVGVAVAVRGGIASLRLDTNHFGAIGGGARLVTGPVGAGAHYDLALDGGASDVEIVPA